jgi:RNA polymerase sigma-70 factor, ECF subfamily
VSAVLGLKLSTDCPSAASELDASFRVVYRDHFQLVWRGLKRLGVTEAALEDAVQDVFLVVYRRWHDFEGRSQLRTWIYGIAVRVAKDYRRAEARRSRRVQRLAELAAAEPDSAAPADQAELREANRLCYRALGALGDEERAVFVLVELSELSVQETATALQLHVRTCQRRLKNARRAFERAVTRELAARRPES